MAFKASLETVKENGLKWLGNELLNKASTDPVFSERLDKYTINMLMQHCYTRAKELQNNNYAVIDNETVLEWCVHAVDEQINIAEYKPSNAKKIESKEQSKPIEKETVVGKPKIAKKEKQKDELSIFDFGVELDDGDQ